MVAWPEAALPLWRWPAVGLDRLLVTRTAARTATTTGCRPARPLMDGGNASGGLSVGAHLGPRAHRRRRSGTVIYINDALDQVLHREGHAFQREQPAFRPTRVVGGSIGCLLRRSRRWPPGQRLRGRCGRRVSGSMTLGGRRYSVTTTGPYLRLRQGTLLGTVGQWLDIHEPAAVRSHARRLHRGDANRRRWTWRRAHRGESSHQGFAPQGRPKA
jgi:hypothetical protein